jgi:hypothetical protein
MMGTVSRKAARAGLRAYTGAAGAPVSLDQMSRLSGVVPVSGALMPVLLSFADPANPGSARMVSADDAAAALGAGYRLGAVTAEIVPNGYWPLDFGGALGEPVTLGIAAKLPWLTGADAPAAALRAAGLPAAEAIDAKQAFWRP